MGAVGSASAGGTKTFVLRWEGTKWSRVSSPSPGQTTVYNGPTSVLLAASALSPSDAWAVGGYSSTTTDSSAATLIEHWNGTKWSKA